MSTRTLASGLLACAFLCAEAHADTALTHIQANAAAAKTTAVKDGWQGSVAFRYLETTGNSNTTTLNAQPNYNLLSANYLFGNVDYLRDVFSGYERRTSEVVGYGHRLLATDSQQLDLEVGGGARQTRYTDQTSDSEPGELVSGSYLWKFTKTSNFSENLTFIHGASNTYSQSVTALTVNLAASFALSVSYTIPHNSAVLPVFKNPDTITAISLVYSFAPAEPPKNADAALAPATPPP